MSNQRDGFVVNLTDYKDRASARLEPGEYLIRITDGELVETKAGDPMVNLFYGVVGGPYDGSPLIDRLVLTDKSLWRMVKVLRALGIKIEKKNMQFQFKTLTGRTMVVKVEDGEPYKGEVKSEIRDYAPASKVIDPIPEAEVVFEEAVEFDSQDTADTDATDDPFPGDVNAEGEINVPDGGVTL